VAKTVSFSTWHDKIAEICNYPVCGIPTYSLESGTPGEALPSGIHLSMNFECADEGKRCFCKGIARFGVPGQWVDLPVAGNIYCTVTRFVTDPAPGQAKKCYCFEDTQYGTMPPTREPKI